MSGPSHTHLCPGSGAHLGRLTGFLWKRGILKVVRLSVKMLGGRKVGEVGAPHWSGPTSDGLYESNSAGLPSLDLVLLLPSPDCSTFPLSLSKHLYLPLVPLVRILHFWGDADGWSYIER